MSITSTPLVLSIVLEEIRQIGELMQFLSLLPASHASIANPRLLLFGPESKRTRLLLFELQRFQKATSALRSLRILLPLVEVSLLDAQNDPLLQLRIEEARSDPENGTFEVQSIQLSAGDKPIVSVPSCKATIRRNAAFMPTVSEFSEFLRAKQGHREAVFVDVPSNSPSFALFFQQNLHRPLFSVSLSLPSIALSFEQQSFLPFLQCLQQLPSASFSLPTLPFYIPAIYEVPFMEFACSCPSLSLQIQSDLFKWKERSRFLSLSLSELSFQCFFGSQNMDLTLHFEALRAFARFIHLASPLTQETLTGYDDSVELESWEAAKLRFVSLPSREIELLSIDSSQIHFATALHVLPSLHNWLLNEGEQSHSSLQLCEIGLGTRIRADCQLGMIQLDWDDVIVADLVWAILSICDLFAVLLPTTPPSETPAGEELFCSDCLFQFSTPLLSLTCIYNQKTFQELLAPAVFFEFGFSQQIEDDRVFPSQFVCGVQTRGVYWNDLTNELPTNQVFLSSHRF